MKNKPVRATKEARRCCHCHQWKPHSEFSTSKVNAFGSASECKKCCVIRQQDYVARNKEKVAQRRRISSANAYRNNPEPAKQRSANWAKNNKKRHNQHGAEWAKLHPEIVNAQTKRYNEKYPEKSTARHAKRKARKIQAVPKWFNEFDEFVITEAHHLAKQRVRTTGIKWHVDHIVPLQSQLVCGLHCAVNTQVIPAFTNIQKLNRYWPEMPE